MDPYTIHGTGDNRILVLETKAPNQYKFYTIVDGEKQAVRLKKSGAKFVAAIRGNVVVYKKPTANQYHYEHMRNNSRRLSGWGGVEPDMLLDHLLEYVEEL